MNFNNKQQVKMGFSRNENDRAGAGDLKSPHVLPSEAWRQGNSPDKGWHQLHGSPSVWSPKMEDAAACGAGRHPGRVGGRGRAGKQVKGCGVRCGSFPPGLPCDGAAGRRLCQCTAGTIAKQNQPGTLCRPVI